MIDGPGRGIGTTEIIATDPLAQTEMAIAAIELWHAPRIIMSYGTSFHTGEDTDYEGIIAKQVGGEIHSHPFIQLGGLVLDVKHHVSGSQVPYGRGTAIAREQIWNQLWADRREQPKADIIVRAHTHAFSYIGGADWLAMTLPALQAATTKYGARRFSGTVDWGIVTIEANEGKEFTWAAHLVKLKANQQGIIRI